MAKSRPTKGGVPEPTVEVDLGGKKVKGVSKDFEIEKESWNVYRLADGSKVKVRVVVESIVLTEEQREGEPVVVVRQGIIVTYEPSKPSKEG